MIVGSAEQRALRLKFTADGLEMAGFPEIAAMLGMAADDILQLSAALAGEQIARETLQARCARQHEILGKAVYQNLVQRDRKEVA